VIAFRILEFSGINIEMALPGPVNVKTGPGIAGQRWILVD